MRRYLLFIFLFYIAYPAYSFTNQPEIDSFKDYISYKLGSNLLLIDPVIARKADITYIAGSKEKEISNIVFQLGVQRVSISFWSGPSEDPTFMISIGNKEAQLGGEKLYVSSGGYFYLVKRSNEHFEKKLKFTLIGGILKEIKQPFYLIDMKCETSTPLAMYEEKCNQGNIIAELPQNTTVHILAMDNAPAKCDSDIVPDNAIRDKINNYLVATPFGLVGWVVSTRGYLHFRPGKPLGCMRFYGD